MKYRIEIDGLRAIAVVPVVLFHAGLPGFAGGYAGVDVFFVISGFLITSLILQDLEKDRFSILAFYERRARRILPALTLVVLATTIVATFTMRPERLEEFGASVAATMFFGANIYFWRKTDYFGTAAEERPLIHMWSLAVEEQFYIVFPIVLLAIWRMYPSKSGRVLWMVVMSTAAASFGLAFFASDWRPIPNYYLPVTRAWELLAGSVVALWLKGQSPQKSRFSSLLSSFGLVLVLLSLLLIDETTPWPGPWTLMPVIGTALIVAFASNDCPTGRVLSFGPLVFVGLLSYSMYLWHQPLFAFARMLNAGHPSLFIMTTLAIATLPLSWLSWRFVELLFREPEKRNGFRRRSIFSASLISIFGLAALGLVPVVSPYAAEHIFLARASDDVIARYEMQSRATDVSAFRPEFGDSGDRCHFRYDLVTEEAEETFVSCTDNGRRAVLVTGGSHAIDLFHALRLSSDVDVLIGFARGFCRPHRRLQGPPPYTCPYEGLRELVEKYPDRIEVIIYTQAGFTFFDDYRQVSNADGLHMDLVEQVGEYLHSLSQHVPVIALGPRPILGVDPRRLSLHHPFEEQLANSQNPGTDAAMSAIDSAFAEVLERRGIPYLSHAEAIGTILPQEAMIDGTLTYRDQDHWSLYGAEIFGSRVIDTLTSAGFLQTQTSETR